MTSAGGDTRIVVTDDGHEAAVLEGLRSEQAPLTRGELDEIRKLAMHGRGACKQGL